MFKTYSTELAGRNLTIETGKVAGLANGSVWVRYGETVVMVNVTAAKEPKEGIDFFPLSVDYEEKLYSVGKIPGGFTKREGKPAEKAVRRRGACDREADSGRDPGGRILLRGSGGSGQKHHVCSRRTENSRPDQTDP